MVAIYVFLLMMVAKIAHSRKKRVAADEGEVLGVVDVVPCGQAHGILQSSNSSGILYSIYYIALYIYIAVQPTLRPKLKTPDNQAVPPSLMCHLAIPDSSGIGSGESTLRWVFRSLHALSDDLLHGLFGWPETNRMIGKETAWTIIKGNDGMVCELSSNML